MCIRDRSMTDIPPYYDPNSTELTVITNVRNEIFDIDEETKEAGFVRYDYDYFAVKLNYELDTVSHVELETDGSALITSYLTDSSLYTLVLDSFKTSLDCYSLTDGKRIAVERGLDGIQNEGVKRAVGQVRGEDVYKRQP